MFIYCVRILLSTTFVFPVVLSQNFISFSHSSSHTMLIYNASLCRFICLSSHYFFSLFNFSNTRYISFTRSSSHIMFIQITSFRCLISFSSHQLSSSLFIFQARSPHTHNFRINSWALFFSNYFILYLVLYLPAHFYRWSASSPSLQTV